MILLSWILYVVFGKFLISIRPFGAWTDGAYCFDS
jgi:hypothetical protein